MVHGGVFKDPKCAESIDLEIAFRVIDRILVRKESGKMEDD